MDGPKSTRYVEDRQELAKVRRSLKKYRQSDARQ